MLSPTVDLMKAADAAQTLGMTEEVGKLLRPLFRTLQDTEPV
jgi:hypothetical protein